MALLYLYTWILNWSKNRCKLLFQTLQALVNIDPQAWGHKRICVTPPLLHQILRFQNLLCSKFSIWKYLPPPQTGNFTLLNGENVICDVCSQYDWDVCGKEVFSCGRHWINTVSYWFVMEIKSTWFIIWITAILYLTVFRLFLILLSHFFMTLHCRLLIFHFISLGTCFWMFVVLHW